MEKLNVFLGQKITCINIWGEIFEITIGRDKNESIIKKDDMEKNEFT